VEGGEGSAMLERQRVALVVLCCSLDVGWMLCPSFKHVLLCVVQVPPRAALDG